MAAKQTLRLVIGTVFVFSLLSCRTMAQGPAPEPSAVAFGPSAEAPAPGPDCMTNLLNMSDCLTYAETGSNLTKPDKPCCPELAGLVESSPQCLCYLFDKNVTSGYGIDINRALKLPDLCQVQTPPISLCSVITGTPIGSPSPSEGPSSQGQAPDQGLSTSPTNENANGASNIAVSASASFIALAVAFLPTLFGINFFFHSSF